MAPREGALVLAFSVIFCAVTLHNIFAPSSARSPSTLHARAKLKPDCTTALAGDLYGLGVRLGIYFQWLSGWVANNFIVDEIAGALDANAVFLLALLISITNSTKSNDLTQIDGMIILMLCSGTILSVLSLWGYRTCIYKKEGLDGISRFGGFGTHLRLMLIVGVGCYGIWFWSVGLLGLPRGLDDYGTVSASCPRQGIVVLNIPIQHEASMGGLILSSIALVYGGVMILVAPLAGVTRVMKMVSFFKTKSYADSSRLRYATGASREQLALTSKILGVLNFVYLLFISTIIEITLNENYQIGVLGGTPQSMNGQILKPAQLLPMLIGAFSFARILWISFELWRYPDGDISPSLGRNSSRRRVKSRNKSFNVFALFSERVEQGVAEEEQGLRINTDAKTHDTEPAEDKQDYYTSLHRRLGLWERMLITWLPWLSLLYFWPWQKEVILSPIMPADEMRHLQPRNEPISLKTPHKTRFADALDDDLDVDDMDTSYHRPSSRVSVTEQYDPHQPRTRL